MGLRFHNGHSGRDTTTDQDNPLDKLYFQKIQISLPGNLILFAPYMIAVAAGEGVKTVFSMLPITSAMLMPARLAEGAVPWWQLGVAVAANLVALVLTIRFGARIYERTLMRTERRIGFREALTLKD